MPGSRSIENDFIDKLTTIVEHNISNESFGVSELAEKVGMSRSNLLRKVKKLTNLSASQFIRNIRLNRANELLKESSFTVSEISYKVGFGSPSYFIKCYGEYYGYPPGEEGKIENRELSGNVEESGNTNSGKNKEPNRTNTRVWIKWSIIFVVVIALAYVISLIDIFPEVPSPSERKTLGKKSIAVLPFINDSNDSTNVYIINGLMESTLNKLQKIEELRVISRTSVEKYRNKPKTTPEIAKELKATYLIEGSGQKIGNQILVNIQLIEAATDNHLWSKQYKRDTQDIFTLQTEIAKNIAEEIEVIISPEEAERIEKRPTDNLVAYDEFLKGLNLLNNPVGDNVKNSIPYFLEAIKHDNKFARSYAAIAIAYYVMEENRLQKMYTDSVNYYADQALFYDAELAQSLIAKALFYMAHKEYELAVPYFEKALELNPNSDVVLIFMVDLYVSHLPNTKKYLEYALRGLEIDLVAAYDSGTASYSYLHISNAFIQSGFVEEAEKYINMSLDYLPGNLYSEYVKAFILYSKNKDLEQLNSLLLTALGKDSTRLDILQEVAKSYYYLGDYRNSYKYYKRFVELREKYNLDIYNFENCKIAYVFDQMGENEKADAFMEKFKTDVENAQSIYRQLSLALYYSYRGDADKAMEHLKLFSREENYHYWTVLFTPIDPLMNNIKELPEFKKVFAEIENKFNKYHKEIKKSLEEKELL